MKNHTLNPEAPKKDAAQTTIVRAVTEKPAGTFHA